MAEVRSEQRPFKSRFGAGWITPIQYLAENMCDRIARRDRVQLTDHFWLGSKAWDKEFCLQTVHASVLLRKFQVEAILAALRTTRGKNLYSLGLKSVLIPLIEREQLRLDTEKKAAAVKVEAEPAAPAPVEPAQVEQPRPALPAQNSLLGKLRDL
jgi:hypothetical protein